ncbi:DNA cytosine methyltransferase [Xanthomonas vesicatoria]|uniref:DNA cytosine methyltransferase n=1 Tax=Xanthomonas vesicatoria TaxID=56460 RepID=UPI0031C61C61|nr:hypothetical protein [Xanthomonas vesicatoria]
MHSDLSEWVHPHLIRWITGREAARLQSFHDGFILRGSEWQQRKQVGNARPGRAVSRGSKGSGRRRFMRRNCLGNAAVGCSVANALLASAPLDSPMPPAR